MQSNSLATAGGWAGSGARLVLAALALLALQAPLRGQPTVDNASNWLQGPDQYTGDQVYEFGFTWSYVSSSGSYDYGQYTINGGSSGPYEPCNCSGLLAADVEAGEYGGFFYQFGSNNNENWATYVDWPLFEPVFDMPECDSCPSCNVSGVTPQQMSWGLQKYYDFERYEDISVY